MNNTLADNDSPAGSGIFADGFDIGAVLANNIIVAPVGQTAVFCGDFNDLNSPQFRSNDVFSLSGTAYGGSCADQTGLNGNISADPLFVNSAAGDYHLGQSSPSIDVGENGAPVLPASDLDGDPRVLDGDGDGLSVVDMGVDERPASAGPITVVMDIKPGTFPNSINPRSNGVIAAAILTTDTLDATTVDPSSIEFGPHGATEAHGRGHFEDVNGDNRLDLILHFKTREIGIECGTASISISGTTLEGAMIEGADSILTVECR